MQPSHVRSTPTRTRSTHVVPRDTVEGGATVLLWIFAIVLWLASTFGNFVQFVGGWGFVWPINSATSRGVAYALLYQAVFTMAQWGFKDKRGLGGHIWGKHHIRASEMQYE